MSYVIKFWLFPLLLDHLFRYFRHAGQVTVPDSPFPSPHQIVIYKFANKSPYGTLLNVAFFSHFTKEMP